MSSKLYAYRYFVGQFKTEASRRIDELYGAHASAAKKDLTAFLTEKKERLVRWRLALLLRLISKDELSRIMRRLIVEFPTKALNGECTRDMSLQEFKTDMLKLIVDSMAANAEAIAGSKPPGTMRLRLN